jgi:Divergent InlB B-repeat domain
MKTAASIVLIGLLLFVGSAGAKLCQFGYADGVTIGDTTTLGWVGAWNAGVPQDSGRIIPLDGTSVEAHTRDIRSYIQAMNANGIRPLVDLTDVLFRADKLINSNCGADYERGNLRSTTPLERQDFKSDVAAKLDYFLALNSNELGTDSIRGFIVQLEANNNCVPASRVNTAARMLKDRGYGPAQGYVIAAGYGLDDPDAPGFGISTGMPTGLFPSELTHITPWSYDIHSLFVDSIYNLNKEVIQLGAAGFWNKLVGKLGPNQQVIWGLTALCEPLQQEMFNGSRLAPQNRLGTQCTTPPVQGTWPLSSVADHFRWFAEQQPRMDGLIAILWTGPSGTNALDSVVTSAHINIGNSALTCDATPPVYEGYDDFLGCYSAVGWAWNPSWPNDPIKVDVYDGTTLLGSTLANAFRQDLLNAGKGNGYHGFNFSLPPSVRNGSAHSISVKFGGTAANLTGSPRSVTCRSLSASKAGTGVGTVTSNPAGISCGSDCSEYYPANTSVTLTASPGSGSTFGGWSGDADCSDGVVTLSANRSCTATFAAAVHVIWLQPQALAGFGTPGSLVMAGSATNAPPGTSVRVTWRDVTAGGPWTTEPYQPSPDANGIWYHQILNANYSHQYAVTATFGATTSLTCTYPGNGMKYSCP